MRPTTRSVRKPTLHQLWIDEIGQDVQILIVPSVLLSSRELEAPHFAFVFRGPTSNSSFDGDLKKLLFSPTLVTAIARDTRYRRSTVSVTLDPAQIVLPKYKTAWPPLHTFDISVKQWRISCPTQDLSKAYLIEDPELAKAFDYAGSIGAHDLYFKILTYALIERGVDPYSTLKRESMNVLQWKMITAICHDQMPR